MKGYRVTAWVDRLRECVDEGLVGWVDRGESNWMTGWLVD